MWRELSSREDLSEFVFESRQLKARGTGCLSKEGLESACECLLNVSRAC